MFLRTPFKILHDDINLFVVLGSFFLKFSLFLLVSLLLEFTFYRVFTGRLKNFPRFRKGLSGILGSCQIFSTTFSPLTLAKEDREGSEGRGFKQVPRNWVVVLLQWPGKICLKPYRSKNKKDLHSLNPTLDTGG